jgi:hypothetical protein
MFSIRNEEAWIKKSLLIIELIFMCAALFIVFVYGNATLLGSLEKFNNDDVKYIRSAWTLIDKGILSYHDTNVSTVYIMPGLTYILSFFMLLFGKMDGITAFRVFQVLLQMFNIYLVFLLGRKIFNSKIGIIACFLNLLYIVEIYVANLILMESMFKLLFLLLIYVSIYAVETKNMKYYIFGGIVWALACYFRPTVAAYPIVILIMWIKTKYSFAEIIKFTVIVSLTFCLIMSPWWIRNYRNFGMFITFTKSSGNPFLQGTYIHYNQKVDYVTYSVGDNPLENDQTEIDTGIYRLKTFAKQKPLQYIYWYTIGKTVFFWILPFYWWNILSVPGISVHIYHLILLFYGFKGIFRNPNKSTNVLFVILTMLYLNIIYLPFYTFSRYSYPLMSIIMIFAAKALIGSKIGNLGRRLLEKTGLLTYR